MNKRTECRRAVTPERFPYSVPTASKKIADRRGVRCAVASNAVCALCTRCVRAVPSHRTPSRGDHFKYAQKQRRGLALAKRDR